MDTLLLAISQKESLEIYRWEQHLNTVLREFSEYISSLTDEIRDRMAIVFDIYKDHPQRHKNFFNMYFAIGRVLCDMGYVEWSSYPFSMLKRFTQLMIKFSFVHVLIFRSVYMKNQKHWNSIFSN